MLLKLQKTKKLILPLLVRKILFQKESLINFGLQEFRQLVLKNKVPHSKLQKIFLRFLWKNMALHAPLQKLLRIKKALSNMLKIMALQSL